MCPCAHKIITPHMVLALRPQPNARAIVEPQSPSWLLFLWNLQPLTTSDSLYPVFASASLHVAAAP
jgi:hypothetical protein